MNVLLINGGARQNGCTNAALERVAQGLKQNGIESEIIHLGSQPLHDCIGCLKCVGKGRCIFDGDGINGILQKAEQADGFVFGTPVYYAHPSGRILSALDRMFYADTKAFAYKPGAAVASARRAGTTASLDVINKYFTIAQMPVISSNYWNMVHGNTPEEVAQDQEGMQIMDNLAVNMAWMLKCIEAGKQNGVEVPKAPEKIKTNFIR